MVIMLYLVTRSFWSLVKHSQCITKEAHLLIVFDDITYSTIFLRIVARVNGCGLGMINAHYNLSRALACIKNVTLRCVAYSTVPT